MRLSQVRNYIRAMTKCARSFARKLVYLLRVSEIIFFFCSEKRVLFHFFFFFFFVASAFTGDERAKRESTATARTSSVVDTGIPQSLRHERLNLELVLTRWLFRSLLLKQTFVAKTERQCLSLSLSLTLATTVFSPQNCHHRCHSEFYLNFMFFSLICHIYVRTSIFSYFYVKFFMFECAFPLYVILSICILNWLIKSQIKLT